MFVLGYIILESIAHSELIKAIISGHKTYFRIKSILRINYIFEKYCFAKCAF